MERIRRTTISTSMLPVTVFFAVYHHHLDLCLSVYDAPIPIPLFLSSSSSSCLSYR
jgi:hypothetical protein